MNFLRLPLTDNIHKRVIKRLLLVWIFLSIIIGAIVYFVEIEKIDNLAVALAINDGVKADNRQISKITAQAVSAIQTSLLCDGIRFPRKARAACLCL